MIMKIKKKLNYVKIILCDLSSIKLKGSESMFNRWNEALVDFARNNSLHIMKISKIFRNESHIVKNMDPSKKGGFKIISAIENSNYEKGNC